MHTPIHLHLKPHHERWITFPERVQVDARGSGLTPAMLSVLNNNGTVYFTSYTAFKKRRLLARSLKTGQTFLVDVESDSQGKDTPIQIITHAIPTSLTSHHRSLHRKHAHTTAHRTLNLIQLMRFGIQHMAASPTQSIRLQGIKALPISDALSTSTSELQEKLGRRLFHQSGLLIKPVAFWKTMHAPQRFLTALTITHHQHQQSHPQTMTLALKSMCGALEAATLYPLQRLKSDESTTLFLISRQPFDTVIRGCHGND